MGSNPSKSSYRDSDLPPLPSFPPLNPSRHNASAAENLLPNASRQGDFDEVIVNDFKSAMDQISSGKNRFIPYKFYTLVYGEKQYIFGYDLINDSFKNIYISKIKIAFNRYESDNKKQKEKRQLVEEFNSVHSPGYRNSPYKIGMGSLSFRPIYKDEEIKSSDFLRFYYHDTLINEQTRSFIQKQKPPHFETLKDLFEIIYGEQKTLNLSEDKDILVNSIFEEFSKSQKDFDSYMYLMHTFSKEIIVQLLSWIQDMSMKLVRSHKSCDVSEMYALRYKFKIICAVIISSGMLKKLRNIFISEMETIKILFRIILKNRIYRLNIECVKRNFQSVSIEENLGKWKRFIVNADISVEHVLSGNMTQVLENIYDTSQELNFATYKNENAVSKGSEIIAILHFCGFPDTLFEKYYKDIVIKEKRQRGSCLKKSIDDYASRSSSIFVIEYERVYQAGNKGIKG